MLWSMLLACFDPPSEVDKDKLMDAILQKDTATLCVGLKMDDPELQSSAAKALLSISGEKATTCICNELTDETGQLREGLAKGLFEASNDTVVSCFSKLLEDTKLTNPAQAVEYFSKLKHPKVATRLTQLSQNKSMDVKIRSMAIKQVALEEEYIDVALSSAEDDDPLVRASAISVLGFHDKNKDARRIIYSNLSHKDALVRAESIRALKKHVPTKADSALCRAMKEDSEGVVRKAAIEALYEVRRPEAVLCLREKAMALEEDPEVRESLIKTLGSALGPAKKPAYQTLCDAMPFWLKNYIKDDVVDNLKGVRIVQEHNRVDPENSASCIQKAFNARNGYSCYAKMHIALWRNITTNKEEKTPLCPGMEEYSEKQ